MRPADRVFLDAGVFIGALLAGAPRHDDARGVVEPARRGALAVCRYRDDWPVCARDGIVIAGPASVLSASSR